MEKEKVVVDASIVVKWFLEEKYSDKALQLRNDYVRGLIGLVAPSLLEYEVLNALRYSGVYSVEELEKIGLALNKYGLEAYELSDKVKEETVRLALSKDITIYDASYLALAMHLGTKLYTADNELIEKFPDTAVHIENYPS